MAVITAVIFLNVLNSKIDQDCSCISSSADYTHSNGGVHYAYVNSNFDYAYNNCNVVWVFQLSAAL